MIQLEIARNVMRIHLSTRLQVICNTGTLKLESGALAEDDLHP
ncbi:Rpn family recombination-promoting nuclease/putative transposase [Enterobacter bugandensis]